MSQAKTIPSVQPIEARGYAHPEVLVSTDWVARHLDDPGVRLVESDEDVLLYEVGHIPGAVKVDWVADLNDPLTRDYIGREQLEEVLRSKGIGRDTTIVLYSDRNNWWATYTFWVLRLFGTRNVKVLDGGRARWEDEGRELSTAVPEYPRGDIVVEDRDDARVRAFRDEVLRNVEAAGGRWWTSEARRSTGGSASTCRITRTRVRCEAGTSRLRATCRGAARSIQRRTPSGPRTSCAPSIRTSRGSTVGRRHHLLPDR